MSGDGDALSGDGTRESAFAPLPTSKNALKRLGERLGAGNAGASDDDLLNDFILSYAEVLEYVQELVATVGYLSTSRLKTRQTLVEKLRRDTATKLTSIHDIAGLRVTVSDRSAQDEAAFRIRMAAERAGCTVKAVDRLREPMHGYRAIHLVIYASGRPVELQIRTQLQDLWAQVSERMADRLGRGIRYGQAPEPSGDAETDQRNRIAVDGHQDLATQIAELEEVREQIMQVEAQIADRETKPEDIEELRDTVPTLKMRLQFVEQFFILQLRQQKANYEREADDD